MWIHGSSRWVVVDPWIQRVDDGGSMDLAGGWWWIHGCMGGGSVDPLDAWMADPLLDDFAVPVLADRNNNNNNNNNKPVIIIMY